MTNKVPFGRVVEQTKAAAAAPLAPAVEPAAQAINEPNETSNRIPNAAATTPPAPAKSLGAALVYMLPSPSAWWDRLCAFLGLLRRISGEGQLNLLGLIGILLLGFVLFYILANPAGDLKDVASYSHSKNATQESKKAK